VTSAHPGWSATGLMETPKQSTCLYWMLFSIANPLLAQTAASGAVPICYAAFSENVEPGQYYGIYVYTTKNDICFSKHSNNKKSEK
jgi:hypothetical protein